MPFADRRHVVFGKIGAAQEPHLAAVDDQLRHAGRGHGEHRARKIPGGAVVADAGRHCGNEEVAEPVVTRPVADSQVQISQTWHAGWLRVVIIVVRLVLPHSSSLDNPKFPGDILLFQHADEGAASNPKVVGCRVCGKSKHRDAT